MTGWNQPCMRLFLILFKNNDADISMTASIMEYPDGRQICPYQPNVHLVMTTSESFKYVNLPGYSTISAWSKLIKRSVLGDIRFPGKGALMVRIRDLLMKYLRQVNELLLIRCLCTIIGQLREAFLVHTQTIVGQVTKLLSRW